MNDFNRAYSPGPSGQTMDMSVNEGLRSFMLGVYNKMALGLLLTAALAFARTSRLSRSKKPMEEIGNPG